MEQHFHSAMNLHIMYRDSLLFSGADKSLARPWKETSYNDQDLQHNTETYGLQITGIRFCCLCAISLDIVF